ncbi:MAG: DivIVA domain-containing protein [Acidimicrobiia bacterium]|nr:DivIVA domain-containing protein [Acidimicrobiia bacterium]
MDQLSRPSSPRPPSGAARRPSGIRPRALTESYDSNVADTRPNVLLSSLTPEQVARADFSSSFRGFDHTEVRSFLARVAAEVRALAEREADLVDRLAASERRPPTLVGDLDEHLVTERLGVEAARVLEAAREAAATIRANAEAEATERRDEAEQEAARVIAEAEAVLDERSAEAEEEAAAIRAAARAEGEALTAAAEQARLQAVAEGEAEIERAQVEGRRMVAEARAVRERILTDMARRRNVARQQLERLRAGRDRLLEAVQVVRRAVDETTDELNGSLVEAKLAGERASRHIEVEKVPSARELELEVELVKEAGLIDPAALERTAEAGPAERDAVDATGGRHAAEEEAAQELADAAEADAAADEAALLAGDDVAPHGSDGEELVDRHVVEVEGVSGARAAPVGNMDEVGGAGADVDEPTAADAPASGGPAEPPSPAEAGPRTPKPDGGAAGSRRKSGNKRRRSGFGEAVDDVFARMHVAEAPQDRPVGREAMGGDVEEVPSADAPGADASGDAPAIDTSVAEAPVTEAGGAVPTVEEPAGRTAQGADTDSADAGSADAEGAATEGTDAAIEPDADAVAVHRRDAQVAVAARDLARLLKLRLADDQNELLERARSSGSFAAEDLPSVAERKVAYAELAARELAASADIGWRSMGTADADAAAIAAAVDVGDAAAAVADELLDELHERLEASVGADADAFTERARALFRKVRNQRASSVAEHAVLVAFGRGQLAAALAAGEGDEASLVRWASHSCGPDCLDNSLAGPVAPGDAFPTGHLHPPAFPGCGCLLVVATVSAAAAI